MAVYPAYVNYLFLGFLIVLLIVDPTGFPGSPTRGTPRLASFMLLTLIFNNKKSYLLLTLFIKCVSLSV